MQCTRCGSTIPDKSIRCHFCGSPVDPLTTSIQIPVLPPGTIPSTSGKAVVSMVLGFLFFAFPMAILAVVFGHLALSEIKKSAGQLRGEGMAMTGLVLGYAGITLIPVMLIIAAIAIPNLLRARLSANETTAVNSVRYLNQAESSYAALHPEVGFACDFKSLIDAGVLDASLVRSANHGYVLGLQRCGPENTDRHNTHYQVVARPLQQNQTGVRAFCSDQSGVVRYDKDGSTDNCVAHGHNL